MRKYLKIQIVISVGILAVFSAKDIMAATIRDTVKNQNGITWQNARVVLYDNAWKTIGEKYTDAQGASEWTNVASNTRYYLEAYYTGNKWGEEFWVSDSVDVNILNWDPPPKILQRICPYMAGLQFYDNNGLLIKPTDSISGGMTIRIKDTIINRWTTTSNCSLYFYLSRDTTSSAYDTIIRYSTTVPAGGQSTGIINFIVQKPGKWYRALLLKTPVAGHMQITDTWTWGEFTICKDFAWKPTNDTTGTISIPIVQCIIYDPPGDGSYEYWGDQATLGGNFTLGTSYQTTASLQYGYEQSIDGTLTGAGEPGGVGATLGITGKILDLSLIGDASVSAKLGIQANFSVSCTQTTQISTSQNTTDSSQIGPGFGDRICFTILKIKYRIWEQPKFLGATNPNDYNYLLAMGLVSTTNNIGYMCYVKDVSVLKNNIQNYPGLDKILAEYPIDLNNGTIRQDILSNRFVKNAEYDITKNSPITENLVTSISTSYTTTIETSLSTDFIAKLNALGIVGGATLQTILTYNCSINIGGSKTNTLGFYLYDDDGSDIITCQRYDDKKYGGRLFLPVMPGSCSSNPHERYTEICPVASKPLLKNMLNNSISLFGTGKNISGLKISLSKSGVIICKIINSSGKLVAIMNKKLEKGDNYVRWNNFNINNKELKPGIYLCNLKTDYQNLIKKLTIF